ncbi:hypothetical protein L2E82_32677 [Cichorium intybus]|uniref:Uncharacterized protein n=1 Tax=Cichorium intybus TaxID=13427 RepID=A0ACB9BJ33_CICIN|nr:hypothetical protein L2E82_32677 [Cichorium intybus]
MMKSFGIFSLRTKRRGKSSPEFREQRVSKTTFKISKVDRLNRFTEKHTIIIGDGGSGSVYKGSIKPPDGQG